jgi:hypothetical protein
MTVSELIEELRKYPGDMEILYFNNNDQLDTPDRFRIDYHYNYDNPKDKSNEFLLMNG